MKNRLSKCPRCGTNLDAYSYPKVGELDKKASPGDWSVCGYCIATLIFLEVEPVPIFRTAERRDFAALEPEHHQEITRVRKLARTVRDELRAKTKKMEPQRRGGKMVLVIRTAAPAVPVNVKRLLAGRTGLN